MSQIPALTGGRRLSHDATSDKGFYTTGVGDKCQIFSDFFGSGPLPLVGAAGSGASIFVNQDTSSSGAPTLDHIGAGAIDIKPHYPSGVYRMKFSSDAEAQKLTLYQGDERSIIGANGVIFEVRCAITGTFTADDRVVVGLGGNRNATLDSMNLACWFRMEGANNDITVETNTSGIGSPTTIRDVDTGKDWVSGQYHTFRIDMRKFDDVKFFVDGERCATPNTVANNKMSIGNGNTQLYQPFIEIQKDGGTEQHSIDIDYVSVLWDRKGL